MTEPRQPIELSKVQAGDTIHVRRVDNAGTENEIIQTIQGTVTERLHGGSIRFRGSLSWYSAGDADTVTLLHRPPTRRAITLDDLKDWRAVPIGTRIEFEAKSGEARKMTLMGRYQFAKDWMLYPADECGFHMSSIKEDTLAQFEWWIDLIVQQEVEKRTEELRAEVERLKQTISNMEEDL